MNIRLLFAQVLMGILLFGGVAGSGVVVPFSAYAANDDASVCTTKIVSPSAIPDAADRERMLKQIESVTKLNVEREKNATTEKPYKPLATEVTETKCGTKYTYTLVSEGGITGTTEPLPQVFTGKAGSPCELKGDALNPLIECSVKGETTSGGTTTPGTALGITRDSLRLPICEIIEQGFVSGGANKELQTYACSELIDPLPSSFFKGNSDTKCAQRTIAANGVTTYTITDSTKLVGNEYCNAILSKTDGGFGAIFAFIRLVYDISLPILVALAVISLVGLGVFIMYAPNGGEDTMKKAKDMAIRIASGFLLLLLMRVFLGLISFDLFGLAPKATIVPSGISTALMTQIASPSEFLWS